MGKKGKTKHIKTTEKNIKSNKTVYKNKKEELEKSYNCLINTTNNLTNSQSSSKPKGLTNLGNTCFFNAVMQVLSQTHLFEEELRKYSEDSSKILLNLEEQNNKTEFALGKCDGLTNIFLQFLKDKSSSQNNLVFNPSSLFNKVCEKMPYFKDYQQQDSHDMLRCFLDIIKEESIKRVQHSIIKKFNPKALNVNKLTNDIKSNIIAYGTAAKRSIVDEVFGGLLISFIQCQNCHSIFHNFEPLLDISLSINNCTNLDPQKIEKEKSQIIQRNLTEEKEKKEVTLSKHQLKQKHKNDRKSQIKLNKLNKKLSNDTKTDNNSINEMHILDITIKSEMTCKNDELVNKDDCYLKNQSINSDYIKNKDSANNSVTNLNNHEVVNSDLSDDNDATKVVINDLSNYGVVNSNLNEENSSKNNVGSDLSNDFADVNKSTNINEEEDNDSNKSNFEIKHIKSDDKKDNIIENQLVFENKDAQKKQIEEEYNNSCLKNVDKPLEEFTNNDHIVDSESINFFSKIALRKISSNEENVQTENSKFSLKCLLDNYVSPEAIFSGSAKDNKSTRLVYNCENCNKGVDKKEQILTQATYTSLICCPPAILTLHIKRFKQEGHTKSFKKLDTQVPFSKILDLAPYCSQLTKNINPLSTKILYSLYGIIEHSGSLRSGHYVAYVKARKKLIDTAKFLTKNSVMNEITKRKTNFNEATVTEYNKKCNSDSKLKENVEKSLKADTFDLLDKQIKFNFNKHCNGESTNELIDSNNLPDNININNPELDDTNNQCNHVFEDRVNAKQKNNNSYILKENININGGSLYINDCKKAYNYENVIDKNISIDNDNKSNTLFNDVNDIDYFDNLNGTISDDDESKNPPDMDIINDLSGISLNKDVNCLNVKDSNTSSSSFLLNNLDNLKLSNDDCYKLGYPDENGGDDLVDTYLQNDLVNNNIDGCTLCIARDCVLCKNKLKNTNDKEINVKHEVINNTSYLDLTTFNNLDPLPVNNELKDMDFSVNMKQKSQRTNHLNDKDYKKNDMKSVSQEQHSSKLVYNLSHENNKNDYSDVDSVSNNKNENRLDHHHLDHNDINKTEFLSIVKDLNDLDLSDDADIDSYLKNLCDAASEGDWYCCSDGSVQKVQDISKVQAYLLFYERIF